MKNKTKWIVRSTAIFFFLMGAVNISHTMTSPTPTSELILGFAFLLIAAYLFLLVD